MAKLTILAPFIAAVLVGNYAFAQETLVSHRVSGDISLDPNASEWQGGDELAITLEGQVVTTPMVLETSVGAVTVKSLNNGKEIAFRLTWQDPTEDRFHTVSRFSDAVAVQIPYRPTDEVPITMGEPGDRVLILHWAAFRQENVENGYADVDKLHPGAIWDWYPHAEPPYRYPENWRNQYALNYVGGERVFRKNTLRTPIREVVAEGFGSSTWKDVQRADGRGVYANGAWSVVVKRQFIEETTSNPDWGAGRNTFISFAVWEGGKGERGARKALAYTWTPLFIE